MKRLFFAFSLTLLIFSLVAFRPVLAHDISESALNEPQNTSSEPAKVEYTLVYPGILPDNPLYFLKAARDRIVGFLISDPLKRAEFNLLTSDKRIAAAEVLATRDR